MNYFQRTLRASFLLAFICGASASAARADSTITLNAVDSGRYSVGGFHPADNSNYLCGRVASNEFRNFLVFDLSNVRGPVKSATLRLLNPAMGYFSPDPTETYTLFDISTPIDQLRLNNTDRSDIFQDLGTGTAFGALEVPDTIFAFLLSIPLNASAVSSMNSSGHALYAVGGALTSIGPAETQYLFGGSGEVFDTRQLALTVGPPMLISEFRLAGPQSAADEFIELYNNHPLALTINAVDNSGGWAVVSSDGVTRCVVPNNTQIPARGHFLCVNNSANGYSLSDYGGPNQAAGDAAYTGDIPEGAGLALFQTADPSAFTAANRLDAVGFSGVPDALFREEGGLSPEGGVFATQFSFVRKLTSGQPQDTDRNADDFSFVATDNDGTGAGATLGAPGPENLSSPIQHNATLKASLIDATQASSAPPNRVRDGKSGGAGTPTAFGTLDIRRRFTNRTGASITRLRFRVADLTTINSPGATPAHADLRLLSSPDTTANGDTILITGTTLEGVSQPAGGGHNSTVEAALPGGSLAHTASVNVRFLLGVARNGNFRFFVNVEAVTAAPTDGTDNRPSDARKHATTKKERAQ